MNIPDIISKSLCRHCAHKLSRTISTEGLPIYDIEDNIGIAEFVIPEDASDFEQYSCTVLCIDLDHIVLQCSSFDEGRVSYTTASLIYSTEILNMIKVR